MTSGISREKQLAELIEVVEEQGATIARLYQRLVTMERRTSVLNHALGETRRQLADLATATASHLAPEAMPDVEPELRRAVVRARNDQRSPQP